MKSINFLTEAKKAQNDYVFLTRLYDLLNDSKVYDSEIARQIDRFKEPVYNALDLKYNESQNFYKKVI